MCGWLTRLLSLLCTSVPCSFIPYLYVLSMSCLLIRIYSPDTTHLHQQLRRYCLNLGPQIQKATATISKILQSNPLRRVQLRLGVCELYLGRRGGGREECEEAGSVGRAMMLRWVNVLWGPQQTARHDVYILLEVPSSSSL